MKKTSSICAGDGTYMSYRSYKSYGIGRRVNS